MPGAGHWLVYAPLNTTMGLQRCVMERKKREENTMPLGVPCREARDAQASPGHKSHSGVSYVQAARIEYHRCVLACADMRELHRCVPQMQTRQRGKESQKLLASGTLNKNIIDLVGMPSEQTALEGQDLPCMYLAHHEPARVIIVVIHDHGPHLMVSSSHKSGYSLYRLARQCSRLGKESGPCFWVSSALVSTSLVRARRAGISWFLHCKMAVIEHLWSQSIEMG